MEQGFERRVNRRRALAWIGLMGLLVLCFFDLSWAQDNYPSKNIMWIIPFKPGGGHDLTARAVSPYLERSFKKLSPKAKGGAILIKNEAAGAGERMINILMNASADGYTLGSLTGAFLAEKYLEKKDYDVANLTYLIRLDEMARLLVTRKSGPKNWSEVVALSKSGPIKWGVAAYGRDLHVTSIIANEALGLPVRYVPFGGTAENLNALLRGDIHISIISDDSAKALLDAGEIRPLLSFEKKSSYPGAPSIQDLGHPEVVLPTKGHRFLVAPPGLPKALGNVIVEAFLQANADEQFAAWCKKTGFEFTPVYRDDLDKMVKGLLEFYKEKAPLIKKVLG
jgi:tripartite-type tricarboxylate transporter receptor subunit TctC